MEASNGHPLSAEPFVPLDRLIDYDSWANEAWLGALGNFQNPERARRIMAHVAGCYSGWLPLISDWQHDRERDLAAHLEQDLLALAAKVREAAKTDLSRTVTFEGRDGTLVELTAGELIHHILNHATYHRGHLRGLAEAEGLTDFPETDSVKYFVRHR